MKKRIRPALVLALALVFLLTATLLVSAQTERIQGTDFMDREVTLRGPAKRVVALQAADCEILYALGAGSLVAGRGEYCNYPEDVLSLPAVTSGFETNIEQIIALSPDLVIMARMGQLEEHADKLAAAGIAVYVSDAQTLDGVYRNIELLGQLTGKAEAAAELISYMKESFEALSQKAADRRGASVYFEASPLQFGLWTAGQGTFMDEIAGILNLKNIFSEFEAWKEVSQEQVLSRDPDYIVTTAMYFGMGETPVEEVRGRESWSGVSAVKNSRVFQADADAITRPGPRLAEAAQALYDFVYGE